MNMILILSLVSILFCMGTSAILFCRKRIAEILVSGICWFFCSYIFSTMVLFLLDVYTLLRGTEAVCFTDAVMFFTVILTSKKISVNTLKKGFRPEQELKVFVIPLIIAIIGLPFISQKNELFGMGQDEGVYQCEAINFMHDYHKRQQDFDEYHLLKSDSSKENFETAVHNKLVGYDIPNENYPDTVYDRAISPVSGIYHGIPTYSAILALWGTLFGMERMAEVQTIFYVLMIFLIYFICDNLNLSWVSKFSACIAGAFSPVIVWTAKSSLTEMFLAVLILLFLWFLTDEKHPEYYGYSFLPMVVFSCYHVSIYTLIPYIIIIYAGMYFCTKRKVFTALLLFSVLEYLFSYLTMRQVQPFYTMNNYRFVFGHGINVQNITQAVLVISGILILICMIYILLIWKFKKTESLKQLMENKKHLVLMQGLLVCITAFPLIYMLCEAFIKLDSIEAISSLTISGFVINTGFLLFPLGLILFFTNPKIFLENEAKLIIFITSFYCVLIYSAFLRVQIEYYYYYARYLTPFIPCTILFAVTALDKSNKKVFFAVTSAGVCLCLPYSGFLSTHQDDTRMEWNVLEDITEQIPEKSCVIIETDLLPVLWLPVRAISHANVYPIEEDFTAQYQTLKESYSEIYFISENNYTYQLDSNLELLYQNKVHRSEDENSGETYGMPLNFSETSGSIFLYKSLQEQTFYQAEDIQNFKLYGIDKTEDGYCWTVNSSSAIRCALKKKSYTLKLKLGSEIPVPASGKTKFKIQLSVNDIPCGTNYIFNESSLEELIFAVPASCMNQGSNIISFQTDTWKASAINPKDNRILGIPIKSLSFEERS